VRPSNKSMRSHAPKHDEETNRSLLLASKVADKMKGVHLKPIDQGSNNSTQITHYHVALNDIIAKLENSKAVFIK